MFSRRALKGRRLAWALLAEPVDALVEADRRRYRAPYRDIFSAIIADGIRSGELPAQDSMLAASAIVGALVEALLGPLAPQAKKPDQDKLIRDLALFCTRAVAAKA